MKKYDVRIRAIIEKTITVEAKDEDAAMAEAAELFDSARDHNEERYEQDVIDVSETEEEDW